MKRTVAFAFVLTLIAAPALAADQWSTVGGDSGNTRYSSLSQINAQNVTKLGAAWVSEKIRRLRVPGACRSLITA